MDLKIITVYCLCDDVLAALGFCDDAQCRMTLAEVMTVGIVAGLFYHGNIQLTRKVLTLCRYIPNMLSHSRLHRRLLAVPQDYWDAILAVLKNTLMALFPTTEFAVDSCPVPVCHPCRSWRCKLYHGKQYLGYCAAKKLRYYGLKIHLIVSATGTLVEFLLTPASCADITALKQMNLDLPEDSTLYGDKAYSSQLFEHELQEDAQIALVPERKYNATRQHPGHLRFLQRARRKVVETVFSQIARLMPRFFKVRSAHGLQLRIFLLLLAYTVHKMLPEVAS